MEEKLCEDASSGKVRYGVLILRFEELEHRRSLEELLGALCDGHTIFGRTLE